MNKSIFFTLLSCLIFFVLPWYVYANDENSAKRREPSPTPTPMVASVTPSPDPVPPTGTVTLTPAPTSGVSPTPIASSPTPTITAEPTSAVTPTPVIQNTNQTPTPTPTALPVTPIAPILYPQTVTTISPAPVQQVLAVSLTPEPVLKTALPRLMNLLTYGTNEAYYGQSGFTAQETHILYLVAFLFFVSGIVILHPQLLYKGNKLFRHIRFSWNERTLHRHV